MTSTVIAFYAFAVKRDGPLHSPKLKVLWLIDTGSWLYQDTRSARYVMTKKRIFPSRIGAKAEPVLWLNKSYRCNKTSCAKKLKSFYFNYQNPLVGKAPISDLSLHADSFSGCRGLILSATVAGTFCSSGWMTASIPSTVGMTGATNWILEEVNGLDFAVQRYVSSFF